jgi:MFS family permease
MTQTSVTAPRTQDPPQRLLSGKKRVLASAFAGTTIEWYDFYLYGTAAALIFNVQFFPSHSELGSSLAAFASLAVGFFARPLGGIIAGHLGDRVGRKALLVVSLLSMGIASTLIGLVPNFSAIGWWAAAALVVLRIVQGLSAGAEWGGSALLSVEHAPASKRGLFGSFTQIGSAAGMLLATGAFFAVQSLLTDEQFEAFGWRIPFLASALLVALGLWIRLGVSDAPEFQELKASGDVAKAPLRDVLTKHPRVLLVTIGLRLAQNSVFYLITVYMLSYLSENRGDSTSGVTAVMIASAIGLFTGPLWGWVSDKVGRKRVSIGGIIGVAVFGWIFFAFLDSGPLAVPAHHRHPRHEPRPRCDLRPAGRVVRRAVPRRGPLLGREHGLPAGHRHRRRNHADGRGAALRCRRRLAVAHLRLSHPAVRALAASPPSAQRILPERSLVTAD